MKKKQCRIKESIAYVNVSCPNCGIYADRYFSECDIVDVWCRYCKKWFEVGFGG